MYYENYVRCCHFDLRSNKNRQNICKKEHLGEVMVLAKLEVLMPSTKYFALFRTFRSTVLIRQYFTKKILT